MLGRVGIATGQKVQQTGGRLGSGVAGKTAPIEQTQPLEKTAQKGPQQHQAGVVNKQRVGQVGWGARLHRSSAGTQLRGNGGGADLRALPALPALPGCCLQPFLHYFGGQQALVARRIDQSCDRSGMGLGVGRSAARCAPQ